MRWKCVLVRAGDTAAVGPLVSGVTQKLAQRSLNALLTVRGWSFSTASRLDRMLTLADLLALRMAL